MASIPKGQPHRSASFSSASIRRILRCAWRRSRGESREATDLEVEYRVVLPQSPVRRHRVLAHPVFDASGELDEFVGAHRGRDRAPTGRAELERLAGEQAALRQVATLVAREASGEVFTAIAEGIGRLLGTEEIRMLRYEDDRCSVVVASSGEMGDISAHWLSPAAGGRERRLACVPDGSAGTDRRVRKGERPNRGGGAPDRHSLRRGHAHPGGKPALGRDGHRDHQGRVVAAGDGIPVSASSPS